MELPYTFSSPLTPAQYQAFIASVKTAQPCDADPARLSGAVTVNDTPSGTTFNWTYDGAANITVCITNLHIASTEIVPTDAQIVSAFTAYIINS